MDNSLNILLLILNLYSLLSLWIFFFLYKLEIISSVKSYKSGTLKEQKWDFKHLSEIHSTTISGRGSLSHYWTILGITNLLIGFILNMPLYGFEQIGLILLPIFPLQSNHDKVCGFIKLEPYITLWIHYICVTTYLLLSFIIFILEYYWIDFTIQMILSTSTLFLLFNNNKLAVYLESLVSTYISLFYIRKLVSTINESN